MQKLHVLPITESKTIVFPDHHSDMQTIEPVIKWKWYNAEPSDGLSNFSSHDSATEIQSPLGWRSLDQKRSDAPLCMLWKIMYGLVEVLFHTPILPADHIKDILWSVRTPLQNGRSILHSSDAASWLVADF